MTGILSPNRMILPCPKLAKGLSSPYLFRIVLMTALNANWPRQRIAFNCVSESISVARYSEQFWVSSGVGLLSGGAHFTTAVT